MSNDAAAPVARPEPSADGNATATPEQRLTTLLRSLSGLPSSSADAPAPAGPQSPRSARQSQARQQRREVHARHAGMLDGLIRSLDIVVYAQISVLYYMDNSLSRLLLRIVPHWLFFTPKPAAFPPPPRRRPYVLNILLGNLTCALLHLLLAPPAASEATRGYLHGGFLIDFVGERGPISKPRLLLADLAVVLVQVVLLAVIRERERLRELLGQNASSASAEAETAGGPSAADANGQDHDAEEAGIRRDAVDDDWLAEEDPLAENELPEGGGGESVMRKEQHPLDRFYTGQFVVADLHIWDALRASWKESSE